MASSATGRVLVAGRPVRRYAHGRDAAGVDHALDAGAARAASRMLRVPSTLVRYSCCGIARAQPVIRRDVKQRIASRPARARATRGSARSPTAISTRPGSARLRRSEPPRTSARTCQPSLQQGSRDRRADEAGGARDERPHASRAPRAAARPAACQPRRDDRTEGAHRGPIAPRQAQQTARYRPAGAGEAAEQPPDPHLAGRGSPPRPRGAARSAAVSTITRTAMNGQPARGRHCATAALSMSTATAPVVRKALGLLAAAVDRAPALVSSAPAGHRVAAARQCAPRATRAIAATWRIEFHRRRSPRAGRQTAPVEPRVESAGHAPAHECRGALRRSAARARVAAAQPMPLTAISVPSPSTRSAVAAPRRAGRPRARASAASAATTPAPFNARFPAVFSVR